MASGVLTVVKVDAPFQAPQLAVPVASGVFTEPVALEAHTVETVVLIAHTGVGVALDVAQLEVIG